MEEVYDFLKRCRPYFLATEDGDQPRVRPFATCAIYEGRLYIQTGRTKDVAKQMQANPKVEVCGCTDEQWVRITGRLIPDERFEARQYVLDEHPHLKTMYAADDDNMEVFYFQDATAVFSSFIDEPKIVVF